MSSTTITVAGATTTTAAFKTSLQLQTSKPTTSSVTASIGGSSESDPNEGRYWKNQYGLGSHTYQRAQSTFARPRKLLLKPTESTIINQVVFGPVATTANSSRAPLAVIGGPRVYLYGTNSVSAFTRHLARHKTNNTDTTTEVAADRHVQTGGHLALAAAFRNDGRLLAVGTEFGEIRVCDVTMRATLCTFATSSTKLPIRAVAWFRNGQHILSGGDDGVLRVWSLSVSASTSIGGRQNNSAALLELAGHGDSIRAAVLWQQPQQTSATAWNQLAFTGSYDHTIRVWNVQMDDDKNHDDRCLAVLNHEAPVEALITVKSTDPNVALWLLSAGAVTVKVWNPISGECVATVTTQHRKTITTLLHVLRTPSGNNNKAYLPSWRIVTGSLDGCLSIHTWSSATGQVQHIHALVVDEGAPITALAVNVEGDRLAIGTTGGAVLVRQRGPSVTSHKRKRLPPAGTHAFFTRGQNMTVGGDDYVLGAGGKKRKLRKYDQCLKQFRYGDALDEALETRIPQVVVAVLEELGKRRGLQTALSNRDEESLEPVLAFLVRYVTRPRFARVLIGVCHIIMDIYGGVAGHGHSETIDELFVKLKSQVRNECRVQKSLLQLLGQLDSTVED